MWWLHKPKNTPYLHVRFRLPDGRSVQQSTKETGVAKARKRAQEIYDGHIAAYELTRKGGDITMLGIATEYWDAELSQRKWAPSAAKHLAEIVSHVGQATPYRSVTIRTVSDFAMAQRAQVSASTTNRALAVWRRMHNFASDVREYPVSKINWKLVLQTEPAGRTRTLTQEETVALLKALPEHIREIALFGLMTGIRRSEIVNLTWDRVDLTAQTVRVYLKHKKERVLHTVDLSPTAMRVLVRRAQHGKVGKVFDATNFQHLWLKTVRALNLHDLRFHDLRHTFATLVARKASLSVVSKLLGHSNILTTQRYAHVQREDLRRGVQSLPVIDLAEED